MNLVYIGDEIPLQLPGLIKPFQHRESGKQYGWPEIADFVAVSEVNIRPANAEEMAAAEKHFELIGASLTYLSQFMDGESQ